MITAQITPERIKELKEFLRKTKDVHEKDRARAIIKLIEGKKRKEVAEFLDVNPTTLDIWSRNWRRKGIAGIKTKPQKGNNHLLTRSQKETIKKLIAVKKPDDFGLEGKFWNVPKLRQLVKRQFNLVYKSDDSCQRLFKFCGFTFHKPVKVNKRQNSYMRKRFEDVLKKRSDGTVEKMAWYW